MNDNKITEIPETLRKCNAIEIMDFGNNLIADWKDIAPLGSLLKLHSLNLKGNHLAKKKDYLEKVSNARILTYIYTYAYTFRFSILCLHFVSWMEKDLILNSWSVRRSKEKT